MERNQRRILDTVTWEICDALLPIKKGSSGVIDAINQADHNGLIYIVERVAPKMKILHWNHQSKENPEIGSPEFFETSLADAYILDSCGCALTGSGDLASNILRVVPLKLLEYGRVFYFLYATGCGREFETRYLTEEGVRTRDNERNSLLTKPMHERVEKLAQEYTGKLGISELMENRLALMPRRNIRDD